MASKKLNITELDFDRIKNNLKEYLKSQDQFTDYNFEGSALSVLLNVLAYNTHYNAYYANMIMNESFLDSAIKRSSVVSRAKSLGYTPRSARSATAIVDIVVVPRTNPQYITLQRGAKVYAASDGKQFAFNVMSSAQTSKVNGQYRFTDVVLKEGELLSYTYTVDSTLNPNFIFEIPSDEVDTSLLTVRVQTSSTDTTTRKYEPAEGLATIGRDSEVYWVQENYRGRYEIYFGDGFLGKRLEDGNLVYIEYTRSSLDSPNGARFFSIGSVDGHTNTTVITKSVAVGGTEKEGVESIKLYAPKAYASQERLVTAEDYEVFIHKNFPEIASAVVWGGEFNSPPVYGKVFICARPSNGELLADSLKSVILRELSKRRVMSITPQFVDPEYTYVGLDISVKANRAAMTRTEDQLKAIITNGVSQYFEGLESFGASLIMSRLTRAIDSLDSAIVGSSVKLRLMKTHAPLLGVYSQISTTLGQKLVAGSLQSTAFNVNVANKIKLGYFVDNGAGVISLFDYQTKELLVPSIGTLDYDSGKLAISAFLYDSIPYNNSLIYFYYNSTLPDVTSTRNQMVILDKSSALFAVNRKPGFEEVKLELTDD